MADRREQILVRLVEILKTVHGIDAVYRNNDMPNEEHRPAAVVFDADESQADNPDPNIWRQAGAPQIMTMRPEIYLLLGKKFADVGTTLNDLRGRVYKAIATDATLASITGYNGRIRLDVMQTQLATGRAMNGEARLLFEISYVLKTSDF